MTTVFTQYLHNEQETQKLAQDFARALHPQLNAKAMMVYLVGDLGAGKSFFSRALIQNFLPQARVKSPTYNLVESYPCVGFEIHHFDLYRLCDPEELEFLGLRDLLQGQALALVEWPSKGEGVLPVPDLVIELRHPSEVGMTEDAEDHRQFELHSHSEVGARVLQSLFDSRG